MKSTFHLGGDKIPYPGRDSFRSFAYLPPFLVRISACHISDNLFCRIVLAKTLQRPESNIRVACEAGVFVCGESRIRVLAGGESPKGWLWRSPSREGRWGKWVSCEWVSGGVGDMRTDARMRQIHKGHRRKRARIWPQEFGPRPKQCSETDRVTCR